MPLHLRRHTEYASRRESSSRSAGRGRTRCASQSSPSPSRSCRRRLLACKRPGAASPVELYVRMPSEREISPFPSLLGEFHPILSTTIAAKAGGPPRQVHSPSADPARYSQVALCRAGTRPSPPGRSRNRTRSPWIETAQKDARTLPPVQRCRSFNRPGRSESDCNSDPG